MMKCKFRLNLTLCFGHVAMNCILGLALIPINMCSVCYFAIESSHNTYLPVCCRFDQFISISVFCFLFLELLISRRRGEFMVQFKKKNIRLSKKREKSVMMRNKTQSVFQQLLSSGAANKKQKKIKKKK